MSRKWSTPVAPHPTLKVKPAPLADLFDTMTLYRIHITWASISTSYSAISIEVLGTLLVQLVFFYIPVIFFSALPVLVPRFASQHQLQPKEKAPSLKQVVECFRVVVSNQSIALAFHVGLLVALKMQPSYRMEEKLPSRNEIVFGVMACMLMREVSFE